MISSYVTRPRVALTIFAMFEALRPLLPDKKYDRDALETPDILAKVAAEVFFM